MKTIIKRNLTLNEQYTVLDKKYIPLENSIGCTCDNCGKLIANIATVKNESGNVYNIGFDCLETILLNNNLLSESDKLSYEVVKSMIPKVIRFSKHLKELITMNNGLDGFLFERPAIMPELGWIDFYLLKGNSKPYNTNIKLKGVDFDFMIKTITAIFPKLSINIKGEKPTSR